MVTILVEVRVGKLKNEKAAGMDEIAEEMIKSGGDKVVDWILRLYNMAFESGVVPEDWRSVVIVPLYKGKGEKTEYKHYRGISLLSVDQIFTLKQTGEKVQEKNIRVYVSFVDLEDVYDRVNKEALWQVLRMYNVGW